MDERAEAECCRGVASEIWPRDNKIDFTGKKIEEPDRGASGRRATAMRGRQIREMISLLAAAKTTSFYINNELTLAKSILVRQPRAAAAKASWCIAVLA